MTEQDTPSDVSANSATPTSPTEDDRWEYITGVSLLVVICALTLISFTIYLDTTIIIAAIPTITEDFQSLGDVGWYGSSYLLASCSLQPMTGKIYNQYNNKFAYLLFLAIFEAGNLICGVASSSKVLIIGRAVAGIGTAGLMNGSLVILAACVPLAKRATSMGIVLSIAQLGTLIAPLIGGAFTEYVSWRWCFYINLPIGAIAAFLIILIKIPDHAARTAIKGSLGTVMQSFDLVGFFLFVPTTIMLLLAVEWGGITYAWNSATVIGLFCGSAGNLALFLMWERKRGDTAMIPLGMLRQRIVWSATLSILFSFGSFLSQTYYLAIYFQAAKGVAPLLSGVYLLPAIVPQIVAGIIAGILVGRLGYYLPWSLAGGILTSIGAGLISMWGPDTSIATWAGYLVIVGIGRGVGTQMPLIAVQTFLPLAEISTGLSILVFAQNFGGALFLSIAQTDFRNTLDHALSKFAPTVDAEAVITAGATGFRSVIPEEAVRGVVLAYCQSLSNTFYLSTGAAVTCFFFSLGLGWRSVKEKN